MKLKSWKIEARGSGYWMDGQRPQLVCAAKLECPVCRHQFKNEGRAGLWPAGKTSQLLNLIHIVKNSAGFDSGVYCPNCGVLSRVPDTELNEAVKVISVAVTEELVQAATAGLGLEKITVWDRTPSPGDVDYQRPAYRGTNGVVVIMTDARNPSIGGRR